MLVEDEVSILGWSVFNPAFFFFFFFLTIMEHVKPDNSVKIGEETFNKEKHWQPYARSASFRSDGYVVFYLGFQVKSISNLD